MITKDRVVTILKLALPLTVGLASSFIMVFVDLAMVGVLGTAALAAIGLAGFSYTLILAFVIGVAPAVQGVVSRREGEESEEPKCLPLNAGLLLVLMIGVPLTLFCYLLTPSYFALISSDPLVTSEGVPYLRALFLSLVAVGVGEAFRGHWAGMSKTKVYMLNILFMNSLNILFNYMFIFGNFGAPALGTLGAGVASTMSVFIGALAYFIVTFVHFRTEGFLSIKPARELVVRIFNVGLPESIREALFSLGYVVFYWLVGKIGTLELAATNVLIRVALVMSLFPLALGMASATLVSGALGKGDVAAANEWGWDSGKVGIVWITLLGLPLFLFPEWFLSLFLTDPAAVAVAIVPLQITGALTGVTSLIFIFAYTLVSLGDGKRVLIVSFTTQWMFFLPAVWVIGPYLNYGLLEIWLVQTVYALIATVLMTMLWCDGRWKEIKL
ncbi:MATE family efflux transporter [Aliikangiella coralliicola]|uniref:Multidrug-efflux transporter n=1 Tax=Aliikangiella coralliicola TaxID=2592383 RepID=A0A545U950_9GAMM|nr:MATE family efflux transporter [Aliikangiella coralliicola]TQV86007.1 MATE family efflux transporter [Aliikangiella coralliicola]